MDLKGVIALRDKRISVPTLVLLRIIDNLVTKTGSAFIGEISATYKQYSESKGEYKHKSVYSQLRVLEDKGLVYMDKDGMYNTYSLTKSAKQILNNRVYK